MMVLATCGVATMSAQRIDINNSQNRTEDGYTGWTFNNATTASTTVDGVTIELGIEGSTSGRTLKCEWWKDGVNKYSALVGDGVGIFGLDASNNTPQIQSGAVGMTVKLSGLSAGEHTLLAYHNNPSGYDGPALNVLVNGAEVLTGIAQTNRAQTPSTSGMSYVTFTAVEGQSVTITYRTVPDPSVDYTQGYNTTSLFINALVFDRPNPKTTATDPYPTHNDNHADCDGGQVALNWTAATSATRHHIMLGTSPDNLSEAAVVTAATYTATGLTPANTYYWRVDEEDAAGTVYQGDTWTFRPRRLAFPGAEGYGRFAIGGRGGVVYHVTTLADNGDDDNPVAGSFRYGIKKVSGPRTIVFDVAGEIYLKSRLTCSDPYVTIAGQTAPGGGVMFRGCPLGFTSDGITRFLRLRRGHILDSADADKGLDGMGMAGADNAIMDHCSISWTIDEGFSSRNAKGITLQRTLISEALNIAGHPNYADGTPHGYAATIGGGQMSETVSSFHHNLLVHNEGRNWSLSGGLDGSGAYDGHHDVFNNVVYNWGNRACDGGTHELNFVGNYYKKGEATTQNLLLRHQFEGTGNGTQAAYVSGNIREELNGTKTQDAENVTYRYELSGGQVLNWEPWSTEPFFPSYATIETAEAAYKNVLSDAGCTLPFFDKHDQRMVTETKTGTTTTVGSRSQKKGLIDSEEDAGCEGFNLEKLGLTTESRDSNWDTDQDGIPDWFEELVGTNPNVANNNDDRDGDYYTDLEEYLNWMAEPNFRIKATKSVDMSTYFAGYTAPTYSVSAPTGLTATISNGQLSVTPSASAEKLFVVEVTATEDGISLTRPFHFAYDTSVEDGITTLNSNATPHRDGRTYNLMGQQVSKPGKGVYIVGGKKIIVKE